MSSSAKTIGFPFIELQSVDSTNNYAMALLHAGMAQHGTTVFTHEQVKGKGQRGKEWVSNKDENIAMSIVLQVNGLPTDVYLLSMAVAVAVCNFCKKFAGDEIKIKWPNDIYWRDRKAGGILIENVFSGNKWKNAIVGIGINCNQITFDALNGKAVSLKQITGKTYNILQLAYALVEELNIILPQLQQNRASIVALYHQQLYKLNEIVKLKKGSRVFETTIKGVTPQGSLVTHHSVEEQFRVGEVEWLL